MMYDDDEEVTGIAGLYKPFSKEKHNHRHPEISSEREIFGKRYLCRHSDLQTRHPDDIRTFGVRLSGHENVDREQRLSDVTTWLNIATMAHYLRLGVNVRVVKYSDCKAIYESVTRHIKAWKDNFSFTLNRSIIPIDDLQALENLSILVFPAAKSSVMKEGNVKSFFDKDLDKFDLVTTDTLFVRNDFNKKHNIVDTRNTGKNDHIVITREDNSDYILDRLSQVGGLNGL